MFKDKLLSGQKEKKKSTTPGRIGTHNLYFVRHLLYCCATTTIQDKPTKPRIGKTRSCFSGRTWFCQTTSKAFHSWLISMVTGLQDLTTPVSLSQDQTTLQRGSRLTTLFRKSAWSVLEKLLEKNQKVTTTSSQNIFSKCCYLESKSHTESTR